MVIISEKQQDLKDLRKKLLPVFKRHRVAHAGLFGSLATGTSRAKSDIDLLVEFEGDRSLLDLVALKQDLEKELNRRVDVLTYKSLHSLIKKKVLSQEVSLM